jgi:hypothetical protein
MRGSGGSVRPQWQASRNEIETVHADGRSSAVRFIPVAGLMKKPRYRIRSLMLLVAVVAIGLVVAPHLSWLLRGLAVVASMIVTPRAWIDESLFGILVFFGPAILVFIVAELIFGRFDWYKPRLSDREAIADQPAGSMKRLS